jgi:hypothetical protein
MRLLGSSESEATSYAFHPLHPEAPRHLLSVLWLPDSEAAPEASSRLERINWLAMGCLPKVMTIQKTVTQCKNTYFITYIHIYIYIKDLFNDNQDSGPVLQVPLSFGPKQIEADLMTSIKLKYWMMHMAFTVLTFQKYQKLEWHLQNAAEI